MGLDGVEFILEVEERFEIGIEDGEAMGIATVRDLHDLVRSKIDSVPAGQCHTRHIFYRLRSALGSEFGVPRNAVEPTSEVDSLVPLKDRREAWTPPPIKYERGVMAKYAKLVSSASQGAVTS